MLDMYQNRPFVRARRSGEWSFLQTPYERYNLSLGVKFYAIVNGVRAACGPPCPAPRPGGVAAGAALGASPDPSAIGVRLAPVGGSREKWLYFSYTPPAMAHTPHTP